MTAHHNVLLAKLAEKWFPRKWYAGIHKNKGNQLFKAEEYDKALAEYNLALNYGKFSML